MVYVFPVHESTKPFFSSPGCQGVVPVDWWQANVMPNYKKLEGGCGELQACQSDIGAGEAHGTDYFECHHAVFKRQPSDWALSAWVYQRQVPLEKSDLLLRQGDVLSEQGAVCECVLPRLK